MKIRAMMGEKMSFEAEVESIEAFCEAISKSPWIRVGDGVVRSSSITAVVPVEPMIAEVENNDR